MVTRLTLPRTSSAMPNPLPGENNFQFGTIAIACQDSSLPGPGLPGKCEPTIGELSLGNDARIQARGRIIYTSR